MHYRPYLEYDALHASFSEDPLSEIHSDLTVENIVCMRGKTDGWYLIDPNTGSPHKSPWLDYAKMLQSLHGNYEFLLRINDVRVDGNRIDFLFTSSEAYQKLYKKYREFLFSRFTHSQIKSIYFHEVVHWLRLMPYKIQKDPRKAVVFYAGMLMILSEIEHNILNTCESSEGHGKGTDNESENPSGHF